MSFPIQLKSHKEIQRVAILYELFLLNVLFYLPIREYVEKGVHKSIVSTHKMRVAYFFAQTFVMKLDDTIYCITQHSL